MNFNDARNRSVELRKQAKDCYAQLSIQQATMRRLFVVAKYTCIHTGLVRRNEFPAASLMQCVINDVSRPLLTQPILIIPIVSADAPAL